MTKFQELTMYKKLTSSKNFKNGDRVHGEIKFRDVILFYPDDPVPPKLNSQPITAVVNRVSA